MHQETKWYLVLLLIFGVSSLLLQALFAPLIRINFWEPDFVVAIVLLLSKRFGAIKGSTAGFILGLLQDALTGLPLGISALPKTVSGYLAGKFHGQAVKGLAMDLWFVLFILIHEAIFYTLFSIKTQVPFQQLLFARALPDAMYTTVVLLITIFFTNKYFSE